MLLHAVLTPLFASCSMGVFKEVSIDDEDTTPPSGKQLEKQTTIQAVRVDNNSGSKTGNKIGQAGSQASKNQAGSQASKNQAGSQASKNHAENHPRHAISVPGSLFSHLPASSPSIVCQLGGFAVTIKRGCNYLTGFV